MPFSPVWSVMFFLMLFLLGLGTQVDTFINNYIGRRNLTLFFKQIKLVAAEAITTAIIDEYMPIIKRYVDFKYTKELFSGLNVFISFIFGIPMITNVSLDNLED